MSAALIFLVLFMKKFPVVYRYLLAFGSNLGDREQNLKTGLALLKKYLTVTAETPCYETEPLRSPLYRTEDQGCYLNFVCEARSLYPPCALYMRIAGIEDTIGHPRSQRWLSRQIDIDILFCALGNDVHFKNCDPFRVFLPPHFFVPHQDYLNRSFLRKMVEKDLGIPRYFLMKHFCKK
jgi:2-amino-4-hydroxy-6-hydroxymethyldihydropteridine diphosphokinase